MAQTLGLIYIVWQGQKIKIKEGGQVKFGGLESDAVVTGTAVDYSEKMIAGSVHCTSVLTRGQSLLPIWGQGAGELQVQCDTGQTYVWPDAVLHNTGNFVAGKGGDVKLEYIVGIPQEILNG